MNRLQSLRSPRQEIANRLAGVALAAGLLALENPSAEAREAVADQAEKARDAMVASPEYAREVATALQLGEPLPPIPTGPPDPSKNEFGGNRKARRAAAAEARRAAKKLR